MPRVLKSPTGKRGVIETHPQRQKIIDAILAGTPVRDISAWTNPVVSFNTIQRYKVSHVKPVIQQAELLKRNLHSELSQNGDTARQELIRNAVVGAPILAAREKRLEVLQNRHDRLQLIVKERSEHKDYETIPGGKSGLLIKKPTAFGPTYPVDTGLLGEFREHEKQVAQELGQWQEHNAPTVAIQIVMPAGPAYGHHVEAETIEIAMPKR